MSQIRMAIGTFTWESRPNSIPLRDVMAFGATVPKITPATMQRRAQRVRLRSKKASLFTGVAGD
jgi:hypothetical protein